MNRSKISALSLMFIVLFGCAKPGDGTAYGAAAGGVIGAGLGAIVGNQVGSAGAGLAIGMASGAAAGAAIGNAIDGQDQKRVALEERYNRQEETIRSQRTELSSLRQVKSDSSNYEGSSRGQPSTFKLSDASADASTRYASASEIAAARSASTSGAARAGISSKSFSDTSSVSFSNSFNNNEAKLPTKIKSSGGLVEKDLVTPPTSQINSKGEEAVDFAAINKAVEVSGEECASADSELEKANRVTDSSDKLFHLRRALRLCPNNAMYHAKLGETYLAMNRKDDAKFEFQEALRLDPSSSIAQSGMESLQRGIINTDVEFGKGAAPKLPSSKVSVRY